MLSVVCTPLAPWVPKNIYPDSGVACFDFGASKVEEASVAEVWGIIVHYMY